MILYALGAGDDDACLLCLKIQIFWGYIMRSSVDNNHATNKISISLVVPINFRIPFFHWY